MFHDVQNWPKLLTLSRHTNRIPTIAHDEKRKCNAIMLLFTGKDDVSQEVSRSLHSSEVSSKLESEKFVAIKLESESENYRFFAQICMYFCLR